MTDQQPNRRQLLKRAGAFGALAALLSPTTAFAQKAPLNGAGPEGSWIVTITIPGAPAPFQALYTYADDGGLVQTEQADRQPPLLASPGHGAWVSAGGRTFSSTVLKQLFDPNGIPAGTGKIREADTLNGGNAYSGSGKFDIFDLNGKRIAHGTFTSQATRIQIEPL